MKLCQRLDNAMNEGKRMYQLEERCSSLIEEIYGDDEQTIFEPIEGTLEYSLYISLWGYRQDQNKLNEVRKKRMYGDEKIRRLETVVEYFGYALGCVTDGLNNVGKALARGTGHIFETLLCWYALPTVGRRIDDRDRDEEFPSKLLLGFVSLAPVLYQARHEDWKYLMIPVATNMLSRIYENYRKVRNIKK